MAEKLLCQLDDLPEEGSKEFEFGDNSFFAVRQYSQIFVYRNICPHVGTALNWQEDQFLDNENRFIQCGSHGALFEIETGLCVAGPCSGQSLQVVAHEVRDGVVYI